MVQISYLCQNNNCDEVFNTVNVFLKYSNFRNDENSGLITTRSARPATRANKHRSAMYVY